MKLRPYSSRPRSLLSFGYRAKTFVEESVAAGDSITVMAREANLSRKTLASINPDAQLSVVTILSLDDIACGSLLTPPERAWALDAYRSRYGRKWMEVGQ